MDFGVVIGNGFQELSIPVIDQDARVALGADVQVPSCVARNSAMGPAERRPCRQYSPVMNYVVGPFAIADAKLDALCVLGISGGAGRRGRTREHAQCGSCDCSTKPAAIDSAARRTLRTSLVHRIPHAF